MNRYDLMLGKDPPEPIETPLQSPQEPRIQEYVERLEHISRRIKEADDRGNREWANILHIERRLIEDELKKMRK